MERKTPQIFWRNSNITAAAAAAAAAELLQLCPTLCNPIDGIPSGSPIPEILQARTLEWVAISLQLCTILLLYKLQLSKAFD